MTDSGPALLRMPDEGRVFLGGKDMTRASAVSRARWGLRRTFQRVQTFGWLTARRPACSVGNDILAGSLTQRLNMEGENVSQDPTCKSPR